MGIFNRKERQILPDKEDLSLQRIKKAIQSMKQNRGGEKELKDSI